METDNPPILQLGHPTLKQVAQPVKFPIDQDTKSLIQTLLRLIKRDNGVGIAAPQIGISQQVIVIASRPNLRYPNAPSMQPLTMLNPKIIVQSETSELGWEGCLSVPNIRGHVARAAMIEVEYTDLNHRIHQETFNGFVARIIQHECDHLMGKLFLEHVQSTDHLMSEAEYFRQLL